MNKNNKQSRWQHLTLQSDIKKLIFNANIQISIQSCLKFATFYLKQITIQTAFTTHTIFQICKKKKNLFSLSTVMQEENKMIFYTQFHVKQNISQKYFSLKKKQKNYLLGGGSLCCTILLFIYLFILEGVSFICAEKKMILFPCHIDM